MMRIIRYALCEKCKDTPKEQIEDDLWLRYQIDGFKVTETP